MTFAPAGSLIQAHAVSSFSLTPAAAGNLIIAGATGWNASTKVTALSSSNVTWSVLVAPTAVTTSSGAGFATVFIGQVTSASAATVTLSITGTTADVVLAGHEYSTTAGYAAVALDTSGLVDTTSTTTALPSLTPRYGAGELYFTYVFTDTSAGTAGSTSGYTYALDSVSNIAAWDAACTSGTQSPTLGTGDGLHGLAVLLYEQAATSYVPLVPPGISSPANFTRRALPSQAPPLVTSADTGTGAESATAGPVVTDTDTGSGAEAGTVSVLAGDTGSGTEAGSTTASLAGADTGRGADTGTARPLMRARWSAGDKLNKAGGTMGP